MKLIQTFQQLNLLIMKFSYNDIYIKTFMSLCFLSIIAVIVWLGGPYMTWDGTTPLLEPEKRIYFILFLVLLWVLKFLIIDLADPFPLSSKDPILKKKLNELHARFLGALRFLKKATFNKQGKVLRLQNLPWYLLIGPEQAGKTAMLANAPIHFVLQRQFQHKTSQSFQKSDHCDWWVTKDACIIDVPGCYLSTNADESTQKENAYPLFRSFLRLIKKYRNNGIQGIVLALPLPEIMKLAENKKYNRLITHLSLRFSEIQTFFKKPLPCQLVITKCDQLPGFTQFFANTSADEISQTWGINLPPLKRGQKIEDLFTEQFDRLIKNLNQQLLFRLHQERNPLIRPFIKDFPLQIERMKRMVLELLKKINQVSVKLPIRGIYLTSAMQEKIDPVTNIIDETINIEERAIQLFQPPPSSRPFFIKQFMQQGFGFHLQKKKTFLSHHEPLRKYLTYGFALSIIAAISVLLFQDFQKGLQNTYALQDKIAAYQLSVQQYHSPEERLSSAISLLNTLRQSTEAENFKFDVYHLLTFYSHKSKQNVKLAYYQSLKNILLPEIKNYLGEYLHNPIIKNTENLYSSLKAYLMLGESSHLQPTFILSAMEQLLQRSMNEKERLQFLSHLDLALTSAWFPQSLDSELIDQTRQYFFAIPSFRLGYIILKNNNDIHDGEINLKFTNKNVPIFFDERSPQQIPAIFTTKVFSSIISAKAKIAAEEAINGNWVLGMNTLAKDQETVDALAKQLREAYVNNYINEWEKVLSNVRILDPKTLQEEDQIILALISNNSPLLQLLQTLHDNTYFEPILSASPKLQSVGLMMDKNQSASQILEIMASLQSLHQYIQSVLTAGNKRKAAYDIISTRVKNLATPDAITRLRLVAGQTPEPIKTWLEKIANTTWHFLMQDASRYLDTAWQNEVLPIYNNTIANRYPFNTNTDREVDVEQFINFFGNPGILINFYRQYLEAFIDASNPNWQWKMIDNIKLPFSDETLRRVHEALRIHHSFFPHGDDQLLVKFSLTPYNLGKNIKLVKFNLDDVQFTDAKSKKSTHIISWPSQISFNKNSASTSVELTLNNREIQKRDYQGAWGWLKLLNQSFESVITKKQMLINLSMNENPAQYLLLTNGKFNPFLSMNLNHFKIPPQITTYSG